MDKHCKGCIHHHNAGVKGIPNAKQYNDWCCAKGNTASKSIGYCKTYNLKVVK
jgi:hypothetical protein